METMTLSREAYVAYLHRQYQQMIKDMYKAEKYKSKKKDGIEKLKGHSNNAIKKR